MRHLFLSVIAICVMYAEEAVEVSVYTLKDGRKIEGLGRDNPKRLPGWMIVDLYDNAIKVGSMEIHRDDIENTEKTIQKTKEKPKKQEVAQIDDTPEINDYLKTERGELRKIRDEIIRMNNRRQIIINDLQRKKQELENNFQKRSKKLYPITDAEVVKISLPGQLEQNAKGAKEYNDVITQSPTLHGITNILMRYPRLQEIRPLPSPVFAAILDLENMR